MATQDAFLRLFGTTSAAGVKTGDDMTSTTITSDVIKCGSSGADADHGLTAWNHGFGSVGGQARLVVLVGTVMNPTTSAIFTLTQGSNAAVTADTVVLYTETILVAGLTADTVIIDVPLPEITDQYIDFEVVNVGGDPSTGTLSAWIQLGSTRGHGVVR